MTAVLQETSQGLVQEYQHYDDLTSDTETSGFALESPFEIVTAVAAFHMAVRAARQAQHVIGTQAFAEETIKGLPDSGEQVRSMVSDATHAVNDIDSRTKQLAHVRSAVFARNRLPEATGNQAKLFEAENTFLSERATRLSESLDTAKPDNIELFRQSNIYLSRVAISRTLRVNGLPKDTAKLTALNDEIGKSLGNPEANFVTR